MTLESGTFLKCHYPKDSKKKSLLHLKLLIFTVDYKLKPIPEDRSGENEY